MPADCSVSQPPTAPERAECGYYLVPQVDGFVLHMSCSRERLSALRALVAKTLAGAGVGESVAECAVLVVSELVGNAVRACGPWAPVVVHVGVEGWGVFVGVHDPDAGTLPARAAAAPDGVGAESGRGLWILDVVAAGWDVWSTPVGKQVACRVPYGGVVSPRSPGGR